MPGYLLTQFKHLSPPLPEGRGIKANSTRIGFLDFLRELNGDDFPYHEESRLLVVGLEDVLLYARLGSKMEEVALRIHQKLQRVAGEFERRNCPNVQIAFRNELVRGETLRARHPAVELPIYLIFGSPPPETDKNGNVFYRCSFNLSSAT
ncbi:MAG: hypothetical protein AB1728_11740 [Bacteroidota bacterium]